ncbi:hypothetical protein FACS189490_09630 [Clostridia bacterium]|nr:hypothetical protein FACS189490_09630 [Clostridia bacterium]
MPREFADEFCWHEKEQGGGLTPAEKYQRLADWALRARGQNPRVFDAVTEWILDDAEWTEDKLTENERVLKQGVFARFREQNAKLRAYLKELAPSGVVNAAVFERLDRFDEELSGKTYADELKAAVAKMFAGFLAMGDRELRKQIAGGTTGEYGTNTVDFFGYINLLKDCDAGVQWALFMPGMVERQQNGFKVATFEYKKMPAMRFLGKECTEHDENDMNVELDIMRTLDDMREYKSGFDYDVLLTHHYGRGVDVEGWHGFWGRFMKADAPVPQGFISVDFTPNNDGKQGEPYISQFAYATFEGDEKAMHHDEGTDGGAMYDVTRNIMLGQGVNVPYPYKYWTAEVFLDGCDKYSTAYMFSAEL